MEPGTPVQWQKLGQLFHGVVVQGPVESLYTVRADFCDYLRNELVFTVHAEKLSKL